MFTNDNTECSTKVTVISQNKFDKWLEKQPTFIRNWCLSNNFKGENSKILKIPYPDGRLKEVLIGEGLNQNLSGVADFSSKNKGNYYLFIKLPDWEFVIDWKYKQELDLRSLKSSIHLKKKLHQFIKYYEKLSKWMSLKTPSYCNVLITLDKNQSIKKITYK